MNLHPTVEQIQHLLRSAQIEEARAGLVQLLQSLPRNDQAWTIAAQLTSDAGQRQTFLKRVFEYSANTLTQKSHLMSWFQSQIRPRPPARR
jgi:hypothetical protein